MDIASKCVTWLPKNTHKGAIQDEDKQGRRIYKTGGKHRVFPQQNALLSWMTTWLIHFFNSPKKFCRVELLQFGMIMFHLEKYPWKQNENLLKLVCLRMTVSLISYNLPSECNLYVIHHFKTFDTKLCHFLELACISLLYETSAGLFAPLSNAEAEQERGMGRTSASSLNLRPVSSPRPPRRSGAGKLFWSRYVFNRSIIRIWCLAKWQRVEICYPDRLYLRQ